MSGTYYGTYPVREISRKEHVIHMPEKVSGDFAIFVQENGDIHLIAVGKKGREMK